MRCATEWNVPPTTDAGVRRHALGEHARALDHLARRAPRERQQQDPLGRDALGQQPRHTRAQRGRLARAGSGKDQQRTAAGAWRRRAARR